VQEYGFRIPFTSAPVVLRQLTAAIVPNALTCGETAHFQVLFVPEKTVPEGEQLHVQAPSSVNFVRSDLGAGQCGVVNTEY